MTRPSFPPARLGEVLVAKGLLTVSQLEEAQRQAAKRGLPLTEVAVQLRMAEEGDLLQAAADAAGWPFLPSLPADRAGKDLPRTLPIQFARRNTLYPYRDHGTGRVRLALSALPGEDLVENVAGFLGEPVEPVLAPRQAISDAINRGYERSSGSAEAAIEGLAGGDLSRFAGELDEPQDLLDTSEEAPIIRFLNSVLYQAVKDRASDVHIEPFERELSIRYRVDGVLHNVLTPPRKHHSAIVSRVKVMANLDIAEKRLPQDGRIRIKIAGKDIDIRVSVVPTSFGERVVLRLLDRSQVLLGMDEIGMAPDHLKAMERLVKSSHGIILVTGPTGSGKTTTLYGALTRINSPDKNIITVEDPVEYQLRGISQIQVNPKIDLTFANGLRSILRQDPNVIMVGEIRDLETAEIAIQASLTGHLVLSTLHTNDAAGAVTRLIDMGIEPFLVASSLSAIMAQRLVRRICGGCRIQYRPQEEELREVGISLSQVPPGGLWKGAGCGQCMGTGYLDRTGIYELLRVTEEVKAAIMRSPDSGTIRQLAVKEGMRTLRQDGALKILDGQTTPAEVLRVTQEESADAAL